MDPPSTKRTTRRSTVKASSSTPSNRSSATAKTTSNRSSAPAKKTTTRSTASEKKTPATKAAAKPKSDEPGLSASVKTPARNARQQELCGSRPGGVDAYFYSDRCILKQQLNNLMAENRRGANFVNKALSEMPVIEKLMKDADPKPDELQVAFNDPLATEAAFMFMTDPSNMDIYPAPNDRYNAAVAKLSAEHGNLSKYPDAFKKLVMRQTYNMFYSSAQNFKKFKGRPTTRGNKDKVA